MPPTPSLEECSAGRNIAEAMLPTETQAGLLTRGGFTTSQDLPTPARQIRTRGSGSTWRFLIQVN